MEQLALTERGSMMALPVDTKAAAPDLLLDDLNRMLRDAELVQRKVVRPKPERPIQAMRLSAREFSLAARIVKHREKAVLISNDTCEFWVPRSQVVRLLGKRGVVLTEWIVARKLFYLQLIPNEKWEAEQAALLANPPLLYSGPGLTYKFHGKV
jgi:hypothetical protein